MIVAFLIFLPTAPGCHLSACLALSGKDYTRKRNLQRFTATTLEHGMRPPVAPKSEWHELMDEMVVFVDEDLCLKVVSDVIEEEGSFVVVNNLLSNGGQRLCTDQG